jgi:hypothetical protein
MFLLLARREQRAGRVVLVRRTAVRAAGRDANAATALTGDYGERRWLRQENPSGAAVPRILFF